MKITILGAGYVGLVTGIGLSEFGNEVVCADTNVDKVRSLKDGVLPIYEPGLDRLLENNLEEGRIDFTSDVAMAVERADIVFVAVGTPQANDGSADLSQVMSSARTVGEVMRKTGDTGKVVVIKSTVPVGTTRTFARILASYVEGGWAHVASNPEFLREGTACEDFMRPDRVVIGTESPVARDLLLRLYKPFAGTSKFFVMDPESSELVKYASNSILATRISFMNELSNFAMSVGADINKVRESVGADSRIGPQYLYPGPGYGGSCLPKDVSALLHMAESAGHDLRVVRAAKEANDFQRRLLPRLVRKCLGNLRGRRITVWGLSFKAETDDVRDSPSIPLVDEMLKHGASVTVHDPQAMEQFRSLYGDRVSYCDDMYASASGADALVLCTEWRQYRSPDIEEIKKQSPDITVFDGRNVWDQSDFDSFGLRFYSICRGRRRSSRDLGAGVHPVHDNLQPVCVLDAPDSVISSRRPSPLQNGAVDEARPGLSLLAK